MITPEKIESWIKEVSERPTSAPLLIEYLTSRLRDLTGRNEELRAENIALISGKRVEEYVRRIEHLEYQLELLKRQFGGEIPAENLAPAVQPKMESLGILAYNGQGRLVHLPLDPNAISEFQSRYTLAGDGLVNGEPPRLLVLPESEELLFVFSSGRVAAQPLQGLPIGQEDWSKGAIPQPPRAGESLVCLVPLSQLALVDSFLQVSRRGFVKKIRSAMSQSILANHYIGSGVTLPADRTMEIVLSPKDERLLLVSNEGYLLCVEAKNISASVEEAFRLAATDHLIAAFALGANENIVMLTQAGKAIHWTPDRLEIAASLKTRGQALFSGQRREQGVRVVGGGAVQAGHWGAALLQNGKLQLFPIRALLADGALAAEAPLVAFTTFALPQAGKK